MSYWDETLTPAPPCGVGEGVGESPYPFNDIADVHPAPPSGAKDGLGDSPFTTGNWNTETFIAAGRHDNMDFDMHRGSGIEGQPKPGSF